MFASYECRSCSIPTHWSYCNCHLIESDTPHLDRQELQRDRVPDIQEIRICASTNAWGLRATMGANSTSYMIRDLAQRRLIHIKCVHTSDHRHSHTLMVIRSSPHVRVQQHSELILN